MIMELTRLSFFATEWLKNHQYQLLPVVPCDATCETAQPRRGHSDTSLDIYKVFPGNQADVNDLAVLWNYFLSIKMPKDCVLFRQNLS